MPIESKTASPKARLDLPRFALPLAKRARVRKLCPGVAALVAQALGKS